MVATKDFPESLGRREATDGIDPADHLVDGKDKIFSLFDFRSWLNYAIN